MAINNSERSAAGIFQEHTLAVKITRISGFVTVITKKGYLLPEKDAGYAIK